MNIYIFGLFVLSAYLLQVFFGAKQIRHINEEYGRLKNKGKVAIGKRPGKFHVGTIVMLATDDNGEILEAVKMQGITVLSKFKPIISLTGQYIQLINEHSLIDCGENNLTKKTILNARDVYLHVSRGEKIPETKSPLALLTSKIKLLKIKN